MSKPRMLIDVDDVVADLIGGFSCWFERIEGLPLDVGEITDVRDMGSSPGLRGLNCIVNIDDAFTQFMRTKNVYQDCVASIDDSIESISTLQSLVEPVFVTAVKQNALSSYESKHKWCKDIFPDIEIMAVPSGIKHYVTGVFAVDDRVDTCQRWSQAGLKTFIFKRNWNKDQTTYVWPQIVERVESIVRRWSE